MAGKKWVDRDPDVAFAQHAIIESGLPNTVIAHRSGCAVSTVANIRDGATKRPLNSTITAVCVKALGYEREWTRDGAKVSWGKK